MTNKITRYNTKNGSYDNPCDLISQYLIWEEEGGTLQSFIEQFDYDSREEVEKAIRLFVRTVSLDAYMRKKHLEETNALAAIVFYRYSKIMNDARAVDKFPFTLSNEIWHGGFSRKRLEKRTAALFGSITPDANQYAIAAAKIKKVYWLNDVDIEKLHFFVEQTKAGAAFPNSLRRMLYIWSEKKETGKTTSATMIVSILNGDIDENNIARYKSQLADEMQVGSFKVPRISECNAVLLDECFYADMTKMYANFKQFMTSANGRARLPYGQEFEWTGYPNYVATSNDSLSRFIKDWGDRRYLSVEFREEPAEKMNTESVKGLWLDFILNSQRTKPWDEWAAELAPMSEEKGDRTVVSEELEIEFRKLPMIERVLAMQTPSASPSNPQNKVSLKTFVDWFGESMGSVEAHKRKAEIEAAVTKVYGPRYSTTNYWLLSELQKVAYEMKYQINKADEVPLVEPEKIEESEIKLPF